MILYVVVVVVICKLTLVTMSFSRYWWRHCYKLFPAKEQTLRSAVILEICARNYSSSACEERFL